MKKFIISCISLIVILVFILFHSISMMKLGDEIERISEKTEEYAMNDEWEKVTKDLKDIRKAWEKKGLWTSLTIKTAEIEQIEISLKQSERYAKLKSKAKFIGEFTMFSSLVEHIPHEEGFHIEEIL